MESAFITAVLVVFAASYLVAGWCLGDRRASSLAVASVDAWPVRIGWAVGWLPMLALGASFRPPVRDLTAAAEIMSGMRRYVEWGDRLMVEDPQAVAEEEEIPVVLAVTEFETFASRLRSHLAHCAGEREKGVATHAAQLRASVQVANESLLRESYVRGAAYARLRVDPELSATRRPTKVPPAKSDSSSMFAGEVSSPS
jgi:hypothetical protein